MNEQLVPKLPRRLKQPTKQVLRDHLAVAASELERTHGELQRLQADNDRLRQPWWKRIRRKVK